MTDPHRLRPGELCRLLNSTPLGEVINERQLHRHRTRAGMRVGDGRHVNLVRYVAWLALLRHTPKAAEPMDTVAPGPDLADAAQGAAAAANAAQQLKGHGQKLTRKQEALIAALLTEPSYNAAAAKAGVAPATVYRWLQRPNFQAAFRQARRQLVDASTGRSQAATVLATEALLHLVRHARRDGDRLRAADLLLKQAHQGLTHADLLYGAPQAESTCQMSTSEMVELLVAQLKQVAGAELPTAEKVRLTTTLTDSLLRALSVEVIDKRLEAVQAVLRGRKE